MRVDLTIHERRRQILQFMIQKKNSTRKELSTRFHVSTDTIDRDIAYLTLSYPIYTRSGNCGGVYIDKDFTLDIDYLEEDEEKCLLELREIADHKQIVLIDRIVMKFSVKNI